MYTVKEVADILKAESLMVEFGEESSKFLPLAMNLKDENDVRRAVSEAKEKFGRI